MERAIVILHFDNVLYDFTDGNNEGSFSLVSDRNDLRFEWKPKQKLNYVNNNFDDSNFRIVFRLCDVQEIERIDNSMKCVSLKFTIHQNIILPLFEFRSNPHASISHMLEFLLFKHYFAETKENVFTTRVKYTKPKFPVFNAVTASDSFLYSRHMKIMDSLMNDMHAEENQNNDNMESSNQAKGKKNAKSNQNYHEQPITYVQAKKLFNEKGQLNHDSLDFMHLVRRRGLTKEASYLLFPYLAGMFQFEMTNEEKLKFLKEKENEYTSIQLQFDSLIPEQKEEVRDLATMIHTIKNDVKRTDRTLEQFKDDNSPYLKAVHNILTAYSLYNKDTDYVQGFGDLLTPLLLLCVKEWDMDDDDKVVMRDDSVKTRIEAESYVFTLFCSFMDKIQQDRLFYDLSERQEIVLDQIFQILSYFDPPFAEWYRKNEMESLIFIYRPVLILFRREFSTDDLIMIWEYFLTVKNPYVFPRFFAAAILMQVFPKLLFESDGTIGNAMTLTDETTPKLSAKETLILANKLRKLLGYKIQFSVEPLSKNYRYTDSQSKFLRI